MPHSCPVAAFSRTSRECIFMMDTTISNLKFTPGPNGDDTEDECDVSLAIGVDNPVSVCGSSGCGPFWVREPVSATIWDGHLVQFQDARGKTEENYFPGGFSPQLFITLIILLVGSGLGIIGWPLLVQWRKPVAGRLVIRPGLVASIFNGLFASFSLVAGVGMTGQGGPFYLGAGIVFAAAGAVGILYLISTRVEADAAHVTKVSFFGLLRTRIPCAELTVSEHSSYNDGWSWQVQDFKGKRASFSMIPFWVWRPRDVRAILEICSTPRSVQILQ